MHKQRTPGSALCRSRSAARDAPHCLSGSAGRFTTACPAFFNSVTQIRKQAQSHRQTACITQITQPHHPRPRPGSRAMPASFPRNPANQRRGRCFLANQRAVTHAVWTSLLREMRWQSIRCFSRQKKQGKRRRSSGYTAQRWASTSSARRSSTTPSPAEWATAR